MNAAQTQGKAEGRRRKGAAFNLLMDYRESFIRKARRVLLQNVLEHGRATADVVREAVTLPKGIDPTCFGAVPGALARRGIIRRAGFAQSMRKERHAALMAIWELADRDAALRWLRSNPDYTEGETLELFPRTETPRAATRGANEGI